MILRVHVPDAPGYAIGDEIWNISLAEAIAAEAAIIAETVWETTRESRSMVRAQIAAEMSEELHEIGDRYRAPDGVCYSLIGDEALDLAGGDDSLAPIADRETSPVVQEVLRFEELPLGSLGTRRAVVRWRDGSEGEAIRLYSDELLVCEGDLLGRTREQLRSLHFRRDRDWLQS
jgi:hypothetical protein